MPEIDKWAGDTFPLAAWLDDVDAGVDTARLIAEQSSSITVKRGATTLEAQTVRIEALGRPREVAGEGGETVLADALVLGYKGHPTIADTDLQTGDRFAVGGLAYEIVGLVPGLADSLQAYAKART